MVLLLFCCGLMCDEILLRGGGLLDQRAYRVYLLAGACGRRCNAFHLTLLFTERVHHGRVFRRVIDVSRRYGLRRLAILDTCRLL